MLKAWAEAGESGPVIVLAGEADLTSARQIDTLLAGQLGDGTWQLTIDLSGLRFADAASLRALAMAARTLTERGGSLVVLNPQPFRRPGDGPAGRGPGGRDPQRPAASSTWKPGRRGKLDAAPHPAGHERHAMSTVTTTRPGRFHEVGFYRHDAEFRALIVPFVEEAVAAAQPVIIGYDDRKASLLRSWLSNPAAVIFIADSSLYVTPARAIASYWKMFERHTAPGATQIRIAGDVPHEGNGGRFAGWDRYESAINTVWDRFPVWSRCLYDASTAAPSVMDTATRTHPRPTRWPG